MGAEVTSRSVVLNVVRAAGAEPLPVRRLLQVCGLFGFKDNAARVAIARLVADGMLDSDRPGAYRIGSRAAALGAHVEQWRLGEARMVAWDGGWLSVALGPASDRKARRGSLKALERLGFRQALPALWLRPDNLAAGLDDTRQRLADLGLEAQAQSFTCRDLAQGFERRLRELWPVQALLKAQRRALHELERSQRRLESMDEDAALVESYLVGGAAIRVLATDPLLPDSLMPAQTRAVLTQRMLEYDRIGHRLWNHAARSAPPSVGARRAG